ncbi:replicative DNA helicase [Gimesia aquarii]|uniref:Replicative DNA helicase n=1 Tax=Gimesia aquarii TaxID=2527964 RepID=A0A517X051_9PLAN|nr:replicative DNA helicase [Gimesia aquarii]QDU10878.1 Replicative DNA helicase [Gimesia aquarii]
MPSPSLINTEPSNLEAERTVIGALLLDSDAIFKILSRLCGHDFHDPVLGSIYQAIMQLTEEGSGIDFVTVADKLKDHSKIQQLGGSAFLADLSSKVPTASHIEKYADIVLEQSRRRQLARLGTKITSLAHEKTQSASELLEQAEQEFLQLSHQTTLHKPVSLSEMRTERYDRYTMLHEADDPAEHFGIRTGFSDIDHLLTAMAPGHFIVLAARPSMGKTALALDIARNVGLQQQKSVGIFSLEMTKEEIFDRMFGSLSSISPWKLTKGHLSDDEFMQMGPVLDQLTDHQIYVDDDPDRTLLNIRSKARRLQMEHGLDLLIIDYMQLIQITDRFARENRTREMSHISENLKQLARELHCPVLALSQLSRECERRPDKRPQLSDLRDSGSIEQDADRVLMLYREGYYNEATEHPQLTDLYIRKNRHGPTGHIELIFDKEKMSFNQTHR